MPTKPRRLHFTTAGVIYLAVTTFVLIAAINSGANLLFLAFGTLVGAVAVSLLFSSVGLGHVVIERIFPEHLIAGEAADVQYTVRNGKRFWPCLGLRMVEVNDGVVTPPRAFVIYVPARERLMLSTRFTPRRRGMLRLSAVDISSSFPFGFIQRTVRLELPQEIVVYPRIGMLNRHLALQYRESIESGTMTSSRRGGNDEFYGVREYRPGDNIRAIHWRSTARNHQLMIREMASNAPPQLIVVLNLRTWKEGMAGPEDVERAIELAVALVCYGFFENFAVGLAIAGLKGAPPPMPQMGRDARAMMLKQLAVLDPTHIEAEAGIELPNRLAGRAEWIIVTLRGDDPTRDLLPPGAAAHAGPTGGGHRTVLAMDEPDASGWVRFLSSKETLHLLRDRSEG